MGAQPDVARDEFLDGSLNRNRIAGVQARSEVHRSRNGQYVFVEAWSKVPFVEPLAGSGELERGHDVEIDAQRRNREELSDVAADIDRRCHLGLCMLQIEGSPQRAL